MYTASPTPPTVLLLPGLFNSGPDHWQSHWESHYPHFVRVNQADWETPRAQDWADRLTQAVENEKGPCLLVGHSSSCALIALWAQRYGPAAAEKILGALLVAPSDSEASSYPVGPTGFSPMPSNRLPFPSIVVASTNDPYVSEARAKHFAANWGSDFVSVGELGHINSQSMLGLWPEGLALLRKLGGIAA